MKIILALVAFEFIIVGGVSAQPGGIPFDSPRWQMVDAQQTEYQGRKCLMGIAKLKDTEFENGVIEFDLAVTGERSYPGIVFRLQKQGEYERIYIRPHLSKTFQNVIQYEGTFNGLDSWQLYSGPGKTASAVVPLNRWFHVKLEVHGTQARLFWDDAAEPALVVRELVRGQGKGTLGVWGPKDGSAYFSNFRYRTDTVLVFPEPVLPEVPLGMITDWEISKPFRAAEVDMEQLPEAQGLKNLQWQTVKSLPTGLVDVSRFFGRISQTMDVVWARAAIESDKDRSRQYAFGYSDYITVFLNGTMLFSGNSAYQSRDPNFQGIVGLNDYLVLPLKRGRNELVIAVAETFGGWGWMFQDINASYVHPSLAKGWEVTRTFRYPESVVYDPKREVLYVSNYTYENGGFISMVKLNGEVVELKWIDGILQPTGMCMVNGTLYVVGRYNLIEIDPETRAIRKRIPFPQPVFPNDVDADPNGTLYITDGKGCIYRYHNGTLEEWLTSAELARANGVLAEKDRILVGVTSSGTIKCIDAATKSVSTLCTLEPGVVMDGLRKDGSGNYLAGDNAGRIFRVTPKGECTLLLNTKARQILCADFEYIPAHHMLVIPTLDDNRLVMYSVAE